MKELIQELFNQYYKDIYKYIYSLCRDTSVSEEITSEVFVEVVKSIATFRGESDIKIWLFSIARHKWYTYLRKKSTQIKAESLHNLYDYNFLEINQNITGNKNNSLENINEEIFYKELKQTISEILKSESELSRKIFNMRIDGYSYVEIAAICNISESSARVVFFRTKNKLKKILEKEGFKND